MNKPKHQPKQEDNNDSGFDDVAAVLPEAQGGREVLDAGREGAGASGFNGQVRPQETELNPKPKILGCSHGVVGGTESHAWGEYEPLLFNYASLECRMSPVAQEFIRPRPRLDS